METKSFLLTLQLTFFTERCSTAMSKKDDLGRVFLPLCPPSTPFSLISSPLYLTLITDSLITLTFFSFLCPLPPSPAYIHPRPFNTYTSHSLSLFSVHPASVRKERQPEQLPAQCVQPSQHPHRFSQPPTLCHAQWGCGSHSCCPHPASARSAPSGHCRWHPHPAEEARPL